MSDNSDRLCVEIIQILTPKIGDHRVIKIWKDEQAGHIYILQEYKSGWYFFFNMQWDNRNNWDTKTSTTDIIIALRWADHYKVKIQEVADNEA